MQNLLRKLPRVDTLLEKNEIKILINKFGKNLVKQKINETLDSIREKIKLGEISNIEEDNIINNICFNINNFYQPKLKRVINATGIVLHTNLGRAPISEEIFNDIKEIICRYSNLEISLETGKRSIRYQNVIEYFKRLTNAEDCIIVNNNASAVLLTLSALAKGKEVIISRGELIEIGGSFRIPEVMEQSGAILREVGTTNKTHLKDYESAINENTALILKVHTSNYRIIGFTQSVRLKELVKLGKEYNIPVMEDLGSGCLVDLTQYGLPDEPLVQDQIKEGVDILTFSGDKLLGGPQAGIILGKEKYIELLKKHPLNRAVRIDKFTMAVLERTIKKYFNPEKVKDEIIVLKLISKPIEILRENAEYLIKKLQSNHPEFKFSIADDFSYVGGGAFPMNRIKTVVIEVFSDKFSAEQIDKKLRNGYIALKGRIKDEKFILDMRTIFDEELELIVNIFKNVFI